MIYKKCVLTIANNTATLDEDIYLFRLDKNVELYFTIVNNKYKFDKSDLNNIISMTNASYFQMRLYKNAEVKYTFAIQPTDAGQAILTITDDLIDEPIEVGDYDFQISLLDADKSSMISMPIASKQLHVCEPLVGNSSETGSAVLGLSQLDTTGEIVDAFDENGNYIRKVHVNGEVISAELFNKWETALETNTKNIAKVEENQVTFVEDDTSMEGISDSVHDTLETDDKRIIGGINEVNKKVKDITNKDNIKWEAFDKGYITIVFDDFNDDLADVFTLFKSKNIPLSCAIPAIKIELGKDVSVLHDVENNGGEILCHGYTSNPITSNSTIDFIKTEFEKSKFLLEKNGLRINGYVRAGGEGSIPFTDILDLFYKNYIYGFSSDEDKLLFSRESLILTIDEFKRKVDNAVKNKQWVKFFAHGFHEVSSELLTQMLDYVNSSAIVPVTYSTMYSKFVIGNLNTERYMTKSDNISAFNYIKEIDDRTFYHEDVNLLKNSAWSNFVNDTKWIKDKTNYSKDVYWNVYDRGFYNAIRVNLSDKATVGSIKIYQDTGLSRANIGEILHAGLTVQQQTDNNSITLRIYKQLETETELTLVAEKTYTGKLSDEYISVEWISESSQDVTNYRYEIEVKHPDANSSNLTILYLPRLTFKKIDNRYKNITY